MRHHPSCRVMTGLALLLAAWLITCGPKPAPDLPTATSAGALLPATDISTNAPVSSATTASTAPGTPEVAATHAPSPTPTPSVVRTVTPSRAVVLIRPSPAAPTATVGTPAVTPVWPPSPLDRTENILVMGKDQRPGDGAWRTDSIVIVAVDQMAGQVGIVSVPRDLYVEIPGMGLGRINQADYFGETSRYPGGGPALLRRVLTETLGIPTQHFVRIEYDGLSRLVDALGGVTVTLDCPLYERTPVDSSPNGVVDWTLPAGPVWLDGASAKKFATYRYATTDYGRARRQQQLIWAIRNRVLQIDALPRIPELWKALASMFVTDLNLLDVVKLAGVGAALQPERVHGLVLGENVMDYYITPEGAWVVVISDYNRIAAEKEQLFAQRPLASFNVSTGDPGAGCAPPPTPPPTFTPAPSPPSTPTATFTPTASGAPSS